MTETKVIHSLKITAAGPGGYREAFTVEDEDRALLDPRYIDVQGYCYERYGDDDDYVEVRLDLIVARDFKIYELKPETEEADQEAQDLLAHPPEPGALKRQEEQRR